MNTQTPNLAPEIIANLEHLFYVYSPGEISHYIRKLLVCFIINEKDTPHYHDDLINTIDLLMDFLEVADYCGVNTDTDKAHLRKEEFSDNHEKVEIHSGDLTKGSIEEIVSFLVQLIQPEKIFCVQSKKLAEQEDRPFYDFLIIVPDSSQIPFKDYETLINLIHVKDTKISFTLHKATTIYKQVEDGHLFYSAMCITEHLIYDDGSIPLPTVDATSLAAKRSEAQKEFGIAYAKAISFFEGAKMYVDHRNLQTAAFMLHQTIELTLRGLIKSFLGLDVRTHSISALLKNLRGFFPELALLFQTTTPEEAHVIELLDKAYLNSRYGYLEIKKEDLSVAMLKSERMLVLVQFQ